MENIVSNLEAAPLVDIPAQRLDEAAELLALAFENYPLMRYFLAGSGAAYDDHLRALFRFACETRLAVGDPLLGLAPGGRLAAVAALTGPERQPWPARLLESFQALQAFVGPQAAARSDEFARLNARHRPPQPHYHLGVIGVHPASRGLGLGRRLLAEVHALAHRHPIAIGVDLETVNPANVPIYERAGYHVTSTARFGPLDVWYMFQPRTASEPAQAKSENTRPVP